MCTSTFANTNTKSTSFILHFPKNISHSNMTTQCCGQQTYGRAEQPKHVKRTQLIDDIKILIENIDNEERGRSKGSRGRAAGGGGAPGSVRDPDLERQCREYRKLRGCSPPVITSIGAHEFRPTSDFTKKQHDNTSQVTYVDATRSAGAADLDPMPPAPWELPRTPSQELRAGTLYQSCECRRRNGLQHDCPRWECGGRPECGAVNPGPCCAPFKARKPVRGDRRVKPQASYDAGRGRMQGADMTGYQTPGGQQGQNTGAPVQPGLVVPVYVRVGGQAQQQDGPRAGHGVTCECSPPGGQSPIGRAQNTPRAYLCDLQGGQRSNPDAEKQKAGHHQQNQARTYVCQPQGHSSKEGAEKITEMPGPHGWPAGGGGSPQNDHRAYLLEQQGGQQPNQMPRGSPITIKGPGVTCLCRPVGGQEPPQASYQNLRQPQFGGPGGPQTSQGPVTLQGPGVTCVCRPAGSSPARAQPHPHPHPQPHVGGGGYVDLYELVAIGQPNPGQ